MQKNFESICNKISIMINSGWWDVGDCKFVCFYIVPFFSFWCQVQTLC